MHVRFLATFDKKHAKTSEEARHYVADFLDSNGFVYTDGRCHGGLCDWYVIGGRWSGELTRVLLPQNKLKAVRKEFEEKHGWYIGGEKRITEEQRREQMRAIFMRYFPDFTGELPYWRNPYKPDGYEDDAKLLTRTLYKRLLKEYEGSDQSEYHADLEYEEVSPAMVGKKWIVVVDYHT
jgi:hypothetical protein